MVTNLLKKVLLQYRLSKLSGIPYTTITNNDIFAAAEQTLKSAALIQAVYKIAKALDVSMEEILQPYYIKRPDFELFKK